MKSLLQPVRNRLIAVAALALACLALSPTTATAVCTRLAGDDPIPPGAELVFVGTPVATEAYGQNALFAVEEIWRGDPLPAWLAVVSADEPNQLWEDAPQFAVGTRYLVVASRFEGMVRPSGCGYTQPYNPALDALRPGNPAAPTPADRPAHWAGAEGFKISADVLLAVTAALLMTAFALWYGWQKRNSTPERGTGPTLP